MYKFNYLLPLFVLAIVSCSSGGGDGNALPDDIKTIDLLSNGTTATFDEPQIFILNMDTDANNIEIASQNSIATLTIGGNNNMITFNGLSSVNTLNVTGSDNTIRIETTDSVTFTDNSGLGNQIFTK